MSATWRKERGTVETNEIMKTAAHRSESWCWRQLLSLLSHVLMLVLTQLVCGCHKCYRDTNQLGYRVTVTLWLAVYRQSILARDVSHELSSPAKTLGSWVRIPLEAWMSVCVHSVFVLSCVQIAALRRADPPYKESYRLCKTIKKLQKAAETQHRAVES
jgi:hypothetical protein